MEGVGDHISYGEFEFWFNTLERPRQSNVLPVGRQKDSKIQQSPRRWNFMGDGVVKNSDRAFNKV